MQHGCYHFFVDFKFIYLFLKIHLFFNLFSPSGVLTVAAVALAPAMVVGLYKINNNSSYHILDVFLFQNLHRVLASMYIILTFKLWLLYCLYE